MVENHLSFSLSVLTSNNNNHPLSALSQTTLKSAIQVPLVHLLLISFHFFIFIFHNLSINFTYNTIKYNYIQKNTKINYIGI